MAAVWMRIEKFGGVVKINDDHPLALEQLKQHPKTPVYTSSVQVEAAQAAAQVHAEAEKSAKESTKKGTKGTKGAKAEAEAEKSA